MFFFVKSEKDGKERRFLSSLPITKLSKLIEILPSEVEPHKPPKVESLETLGLCRSYIIFITRSSVKEGQIYWESFFFDLPEQKALILNS